MVKARLTPTHSDALETLLDEPLTGTLHHATPNRQSQVLVLRIVDMISVPLQVRIQREQGVPCGVRQALDLQGLDQVCHDSIRLAMPQTVPCPAKPPTRLCGAAIQPGRRPLPQVLHGVVKVQDASGPGTEALVKQTPQPPCTITEPDHLRRTQDALAYRFEPQTRLERLEVTQDRHQPALMQPGDDLASARAILAQAGQHSHFDLAPPGLAPGLAPLRPKRYHHPIGTHDQG